MIAYWMTAFFSYLFAKASDKLRILQTKTNGSSFLEHLALVACSLIMIIVTGFRYQVGADYDAYQLYFYQVLYSGEQGRFEYGYYLVNLFCSWFSDNPRLMFVVTAALFYTVVIAAIRRLSPDVSLSVFLVMGCGFFFYFMNGMRQMLAAAFVLYALTTLGKRHNVYFVALVLLASSFHLSAIICLLILVFYRIPISSKSLIVIAVFCVIFARFLPLLAESLALSFGYGEYLTSDVFVARTGFVQIAINFCIFVFSTVMYLRSGSQDDVFRVCVLMQLAALVFSLMTGQVVLIQRVQQFFAFSQVILIPEALDCIKSRQARWLVRLVIMITYVVYMYITVGLWNSNHVIPYGWSL